MNRDQIRYMQSAKTDVAKAQLFSACRDGSVAVLIGSTETMVSAPTSRLAPSPCTTSTRPGGQPTSNDPEAGLWGADPEGAVWQRKGTVWKQAGELGGETQALLATPDALYAAAEDSGGVTGIYRSTDDGRTWQLRYRDTSS